MGTTKFTFTKVFQIQANNLPIEETTLKQLLQYTYEFIKTINK
jgi:hypothetical protein